VPSRPPYLRIADEIRRRIDSGELSPGDRVPSTRAITREWGVAVATATKALAVLRQEGLVQPTTGVGTMVRRTGPGPGRPRGAAGEPPDIRRRIIRTAMELADTEGLPALSMRRVASALSMPTMALYRHVPGKNELVRLMSDAAFAERPLGPVPPHWRTGLEYAARWLRTAHQHHPWLAVAMASFTRPTATPHAMAYAEWVLGCLTGRGLTSYQMVHIHLTVFAYVQGVSAAADLETQAQQDSGLSVAEWMARNEPQFDALSSSGAYPLLNSLFTTEEFELDLDILFEFGLQRTLHGIAAMIDETSA
jgi:AcrR family transcriptional regulator